LSASSAIFLDALPRTSCPRILGNLSHPGSFFPELGFLPNGANIGEFKFGSE